MAITFPMIRDEVVRLANENPEFVYDKGGRSTYLYNPDEEQPGCIFGQAFINLGHPVPPNLERRRVNAVFHHFAVRVSDEEQEWGCSLQEYQDCRFSWGEALKHANAVYELMTTDD